MPTLLHRSLSRVARIEPREVPAVLASFLLFFFVLGSYFAVRPVRETVASILGRERVADLWLYTALFSMLIVPVFGWLVARVRRSRLLPGVYGSVAIILAAIGSVLQTDSASVGVGAFFYVWISVLNLMLVSVFWSFLLEMFSSDQATRLFGFIAAGGTLGALVGPLTTRLVVNALGNAGVLYLGTAGFVGAIACQMVLIRIWTRDRDGIRAAAASTAAATQAPDAALGGNPFAGIPIVLRSPYLLGIAVFVMLLSAVNTFLYFEQLQIVSDTFPDTTRRTEVFATIDFVVQSLTIVSQLFLTGAIAARFGVGTLLTFVPVLMIGAFLMLAGSHVFAVIAVSLVMRRYGEYAFIRPGREMLWSTMDTETKYKAKSFIDVPVYRAADYVGAQFKTALDAVVSSPSAPALVGAGIALVWAVCGWQLGRKHDATLRSRG
jgi:AAA family ATP:ADP antiporter